MTNIHYHIAIRPKPRRCKNICDIIGNTKHRAFINGLKVCGKCDKAFKTELYRCPCCNFFLRSKPHNQTKHRYVEGAKRY